MRGLIGAATGLISVGTLAGATAVSASYGVLLGASYGALTGMQIGYELGGTEGMLICLLYTSDAADD